MTNPTGPSDRAATLTLVIAAGAGVLAVVVWLPAALTASLTGQDAPPLSDALAAIGKLQANLLDPAEAWPQLEAANPLLYWSFQLAVLAAAAAVGWIGWRQRHRWASARRPLGVKPDVGIARRVDNLAVAHPTRGRIVLGRAGRQLIAAEAAASVAVIGPTGCGKTAGLAIPAILEWDGPILAASVKTDLLAATHHQREERGEVWVYDPAETAADITRAGWSPLDDIKTWADAGRVAAAICDAARPRTGSLTDADYWITQAAKALAPHLYAAALQHEPIATVVTWIDTQNEEDLYHPLDADPRPDSQAALQALQSLWMKEERLRSSIYATVESVLLAYTDPGVQHAATLEPRIDLDRWLSGNNTIYLLAPSHEQARLRPVFTLAAQSAVRAAYTAANRNGGTLPKPCLILLDEAGNIAPLADLAAYATTARSHGISLLTVWQDLSQLNDRYGRQAQTVLNNHRARVFGRGIADEQTLRYLSALIGDTNHRELQRSTDLTGGRRSLNEHTTRRPAAPPDALRRLPEDTAVLLYGAEPPARLQLRPWYRDRHLRRRAVPGTGR
jgi:type IV secretion system protein VirD4